MTNSKLPDSQTNFETLVAKTEAKDTLDKILERNVELEEIYDQLQPLLFALSVKIYGEDTSTITLQKLIQDSVDWIDEGILPMTFKELH